MVDDPEQLSVSSNGSNWVKLNVWGGLDQTYQAFSILERIELGETNVQGGGRRGEIDFQYPRTDRIG